MSREQGRTRLADLDHLGYRGARARAKVGVPRKPSFRTVV